MIVHFRIQPLKSILGHSDPLCPFMKYALYRVSHENSLKLIGNYFEMDASIKMAQNAFKKRHFEVFFVHKFIMINNILIHLFNSF